ncbi:hypothetical protein H920_15204 [Fukomys damarensis]|uniref:Uncharacterized protein n=1 Tax=Fukomys damarensis TaxID=885580 RepID=A0A091CV29_FUKDA|nr:hypothetical protein H920_15204 [Fukomys damarensis]
MKLCCVHTAPLREGDCDAGRALALEPEPAEERGTPGPSKVQDSTSCEDVAAALFMSEIHCQYVFAVHNDHMQRGEPVRVRDTLVGLSVQALRSSSATGDTVLLSPVPAFLLGALLSPAAHSRTLELAVQGSGERVEGKISPAGHWLKTEDSRHPTAFVTCALRLAASSSLPEEARLTPSPPSSFLDLFVLTLATCIVATSHAELLELAKCSLLQAQTEKRKLREESQPPGALAAISLNTFPGLKLGHEANSVITTEAQYSPGCCVCPSVLRAETATFLPLKRSRTAPGKAKDSVLAEVQLLHGLVEQGLEQDVGEARRGDVRERYRDRSLPRALADTQPLRHASPGTGPQLRPAERLHGQQEGYQLK